MTTAQVLRAEQGLAIPQETIEAVKEEEKTKAGIFLPETANKEKSEEGKVIAVGKGKASDTGHIVPLEVKVGDRILFTKYGGTEITTTEGDELLIMKEEDVLAIVK